MKRFAVLTAMLVLAGCTQPGTAPAPTAASQPGTPPLHLEALDTAAPSAAAGQTGLIVRYRSGHDTPGARQGHSAEHHLLARAYVFHAASADEQARMIAEAKADPNVEFVEPERTWHTTALTNDPYVGQQWDLPQIGISQAWGITRGASNVVIASVDTGVNYNHPDLAGQVIKGYNYIANSSDPMDDNGHGTHTAGTMAALTDNGVGVAGLAPGCKILAIKAMDSTGSGTTTAIADGVIYATQHGAKVINLSLGGTSDSPTMHSAIQQAVAAGVVVCVAAGNDGTSTPEYPAAYPEVISVGATDQNDARASFSNYGSWVDVAAPGTNILSTYQSSYATMQGTSMATPHVAAIAALLASAHPSWTVAQIKSAIVNTGDPTTGFSGSTVPRLDAARALAYNPGGSSSPAPSATPTPTATPQPTPTATPRPVATATPVASSSLAITSGPSLSSGGAGQVTFSWNTSVPADSQVRIVSLNWSTSVFPTLGTRHAVTINGFNSGAIYSFQVVSHDASGHTATSATRSFVSP